MFSNIPTQSTRRCCYDRRYVFLLVNLAYYLSSVVPFVPIYQLTTIIVHTTTFVLYPCKAHMVNVTSMYRIPLHVYILRYCSIKLDLLVNDLMIYRIYRNDQMIYITAIIQYELYKTIIRKIFFKKNDPKDNGFPNSWN